MYKDSLLPSGSVYNINMFNSKNDDHDDHDHGL